MSRVHTIAVPDPGTPCQPDSDPASEQASVRAGQPPVPVPSIQYDLFSKFLSNNGGANLSNTIELWDAIPKYAVSARQQAIKRAGGTLPPVYEQDFQYQPTPKADNP